MVNYPDYMYLEEQRKILTNELKHNKIVLKYISELNEENKILFPKLTPLEVELHLHIKSLETQLDEVIGSYKEMMS